MESWKFRLESLNDLLPICTFMPFFEEGVLQNDYLKFKNGITRTIKNFELKLTQKNIEKNLNDDILTDILLLERKKILEKNSSLDKEMNDSNFARLLHDLILGSIETTSTSICWLLLLMKTNGKYEQRLREEIKNVIGDKAPVLEDKINCNFVMAFISETMRFRSALPVAFPHECLELFKNGEFFSLYDLKFQI